MLNSSASSSLAIIQRFILLATGMQSSVALRAKVIALYEQMDDLDKIAELANIFMTKLDKSSDYNSSKKAAAAREWLENIHANDKSLVACINAIQGLIASFNSGNIEKKINIRNRDGIKNSDKTTTVIGDGDGGDSNILII